jgi:ATP-dependent Clp endopeptidase proteolytic subunit ClpP
MQPRAWYRFQNSADDPAVVDIYVVDIIGDWIDELINEYYGFKATLTAKGFLDQLAKLDAGVKTIRLHINSPGGDVFAALNIANALRDQQLTKGRTVETIVDGLAASAASIIAMAGKTVTMADNALMMIHAPWSVAVGNASDMRKSADTLDTVRNTIVATYKWHSNKTEDEIIALIEAETWMSAAEAKEHGFATDVIEGLQAAASIDPRGIAGLKVPEQFQARIDALLKRAPEAGDPKAIAQACNAAGFPELAESLMGHPMAAVTARLDTAKTEKVAKDSRVAEIRAICKVAKQDDLADDYIAGGMSPEKVRAQLVTINAKLAGQEIDNTIPDRDQAATTAKGWTKAFTGVKSRFGKPRAQEEKSA